MKEKIRELIDRRKRQVAVHGHLYYYMDESIVPDSLYDTWCRELVDLIDKHGNTDLWSEVEWSADTGYHVSKQVGEHYLQEKAYYVLRNHKLLTK